MAAGVVGLVTILAAASPQAEAQQSAPQADSKAGRLSDGRLQARVDAVNRGLAPGGATVVVEVLSTGATSRVSTLVEAFGGEVRGAVPGQLVLAEVPVAQLRPLEEHPEIASLRVPLDVAQPTGPAMPTVAAAVTGQHVAKTNAAAWHAAGYRGAGVKVGVIDGFGSAQWGAAQGAGEVPIPAGTICRNNGVACDIYASNSPHGSAVAEVVHDIAPDAQIYLGYARSAADLQAVVDSFAANGVSIITRSLTAEFDGPGNGTGPIATVIDRAVAAGITWFNSAGNNGGPWPGLNGVGVGSYWRGGWVDADADSWLEFQGGDELMAFNCGFLNGFRWSDWGAAAGRTDYDVNVYADAAATTLVGSYASNQQTGAAPIEYPGCTSGVNYLAVKLYAPGTGTAGDVLEFMVNGQGIEYWQNANSASGPAADSASPGMLTIGAVGENPLGTSLSPYSSRGTTNDGRLKPDVSAATCVTNSSYAPSCFNGTSAATPVAAGAAALVRGAGAATTPQTIKAYLVANAVDRGTAGADNSFGAGEVILPAPPTASASLGGVVTDDLGAPLVGAFVSLDGSTLPPAVTDAAGAYRFASVPAGSYTVRARRACSVATSRVVAVTGAATAGFQLPADSARCLVDAQVWDTTTTALALTGDDASATVTLPFPYTHHGVTYSQAHVSTNGHLNFAAPDTSYSNTAIPNAAPPNAAVYAFWDDLVVDGSSSVLTATLGTAPNRRYVVEWRNVAILGDTQRRLSFQAVLYENRNERLRIQYRDITLGTTETGTSATVGTEDAAGTKAVQVSHNTSLLYSGLSVRPSPK